MGWLSVTRNRSRGPRRSFPFLRRENAASERRRGLASRHLPSGRGQRINEAARLPPTAAHPHDG